MENMDELSLQEPLVGLDHECIAMKIISVNEFFL